MVDKVSRKNASRFMRSHFEFKKHEIEIREFHVRTIPRSIKTERDSSLDCYENPTAFGPDSPSETIVEGCTCNTSKCNNSISPSVRMTKHQLIPVRLDGVCPSKRESKRTSKHRNLAVFVLICVYNDVLWCLGVLGPIANPKRSQSVTNKSRISRELDVPSAAS